MKVLSLFIKREKGGKVEKIKAGHLKKGYGLVGDVNGGKACKELSIASHRIRKYLDEENIKGICGHRFYENITIEGLKVAKLKIGDRITIGNTILEITSIGKGCFPECNLLISGKICPLSKEVLFAKVIRGGVIRVGDRVKLVNAPDYGMGSGG